MSCVAGVDQERFESETLLQDAVVRRLEIIGEAASRLSPGTRAALPAVPWAQIVGMRDRIVHEYVRLDLGILWQVVRAELPRLVQVLRPAIPPESQEAR